MKNQEDIWNTVAEQWNRFRGKPFPNIVYNLSRTWKKGKILDIGCGNGRNLIPFAEKDFICEGLDFSIEMVKNAKSKFKKLSLKSKFHVSNMTKLPFKDDNFDYLICVASFHHLNKFEQKKALKEFKRILKPKGKMYITSWNKWQSEFVFGKKEIFVPWKIGEKKYERYYYMFNYFEFKNLLKKYFKIESSKGIFWKKYRSYC